MSRLQKDKRLRKKVTENQSEFGDNSKSKHSLSNRYLGGNARLPIFRDDEDKKLLLDRMNHYGGKNET